MGPTGLTSTVRTPTFRTCFSTTGSPETRQRWPQWNVARNRCAATCAADDRPVVASHGSPTDEWAGLTGRVASQWLAAFRFVGQSGSDASFADDWRSGMARAVTWHYIQVSPATAASTQYGFWLSGRVASAGVYTTDQLWMASLYDMENLHQLQIDTSDAPIGEPAVRPSQVINAWARTLVDFGSRTAGDGTAAGTWPNALQVRYSGARIGGRLESVTASSAGGDTILWNTGKANLTATILRCAKHERPGNVGDGQRPHAGVPQWSRV